MLVGREKNCWGNEEKVRKKEGEGGRRTFITVSRA